MKKLLLVFLIFYGCSYEQPEPIIYKNIGIVLDVNHSFGETTVLTTERTIICDADKYFDVETWLVAGYQYDRLAFIISSDNKKVNVFYDY